MHRFFSYIPLTPELKLTPGDKFHQISHVFRWKKGSCIIFFESWWDDIVYEIIEIWKKEILLRRVKNINKAITKTLELKVFVSYSHKISTLELIVQKLTELGIKEIEFFPSDYSQIQSLSDIKKQRLAVISLEALEQSGWNTPVHLTYNKSTSVQNILEENHNLPLIVWFPHEKNSNWWLIIPEWPFWFLVWPEWGWSEKEMNIFECHKVVLWKFNSQVLRMETAAIAGVAILNYLFSIHQ
jgi:16S rRNA (uracil1498-N3)-methyltransferase